MIYVILEESGSYSDYTCNPIFASLDEKRAEEKVIELQKRGELIQRLLLEVEVAVRKWKEVNASNYIDKPWRDYIDDGLALKEGEFRRDKMLALEVEHNLPMYALTRLWGEDFTYKVVEVESD
jgi:hypothetical protein